MIRILIIVIIKLLFSDRVIFFNKLINLAAFPHSHNINNNTCYTKQIDISPVFLNYKHIKYFQFMITIFCDGSLSQIVVKGKTLKQKFERMLHSDYIVNGRSYGFFLYFFSKHLTLESINVSSFIALVYLIYLDSTFSLIHVCPLLSL